MSREGGKDRRVVSCRGGKGGRAVSWRDEKGGRIQRRQVWRGWRGVTWQIGKGKGWVVKIWQGGKGARVVGGKVGKVGEW